MDIVIPYKYDVHEGLELRFALRSIEKHLTGYTDIILIGDPPEYYKGNRIGFSDKPGWKNRNIQAKLLEACSQITGDFIMWNDDHFLLKDLDVKQIKYWHNGKLDPERNGGGRSRLTIQNTLKVLNGEEVLNYDIHTPIIYNPEKFRETFADQTTELCIKSFYCHKTGVEPEFMADCKLSGWIEKRHIYDHIKGRLFFSTGNGICQPTVECLRGLFPDKSKQEA